MILLEEGNRILLETVGAHINLPSGEKREAMDVKLCDFDDVSYRVQVEKADLTVLKVSMNLPCYGQIESVGGKDALEKVFPGLSVAPEVGYDITLAIKMDDVKEEDKQALCTNLSCLKLTVLGGPFEHYFAALNSGSPIADKFQFDIRGDTRVYILPRPDRVIVIFSIDFFEKVDKLVAQVFLQEFQDARRNDRTIGSAPGCMFTEDPPNELAEFDIKGNQGNLGFMSFPVLKSHVADGKRQKGVKVLQTFRTFLQYHIKMAKSNFHSRMRARVVSLVKVLNRAKVDADKKEDKKTASGRTFKRN